MFTKAIFFCRRRRHAESRRHDWMALTLVAGMSTGCGQSAVSHTMGTSQAAVPLQITTQNLPPAALDVIYKASLIATGGISPYSWMTSSGSLPAGLSLSPNSGSIDGVATTPGIFPFRAVATDSIGSTTGVQLSINVSNSAAAPLSIIPETLPLALTGIPYVADMAASGGVAPYIWTVLSGSLPTGFLLSRNTGSISGTTNLAGNFAFKVAVTDSTGGESTANLSLLSISPLTASADDMYCVNGSPTWGATDGPANLPLSCYQTAMATTPAPGPTVSVSNTQELSSALSAALCGQRIILQAGATFSGNFFLPSLTCPSDNYLWIASSGLSSLPPEGTSYETVYNGTTLYLPQFGPCYAGVVSLPGRPVMKCPANPGTFTAKIVTPNSAPAMTFAAGTSGVRLVGIEVTRASGTGYVGGLIAMGNIGVDHVVFDRLWCHGDEYGDETTSCFSTSAASYVAAIDNYFSDFYCISVIGHCTDAHPIQGGGNILNTQTESVLKIVNNFMEGAGESTIILGGGQSNTTPSNIEFRLNTGFKPLQWNPADPSYNGGVSGHPLVVKGGFELKNAQLFLYEGNTLINDWGGFSQEGQAILLTPKNQSLGTGSVCPNCFVADVTIRYSRVNTATSIGQFSSVAGDNGGLSSGGYRWSIHDVVADNLGYPTCYKCSVSSSSTMQMIESPNVGSSSQTEHDVTVNHVTAVYASTSKAPAGALGVSGAPISTGLNMANITWTNNVFWSGVSGTSNSIGGGIATNCAYGHADGNDMINSCWYPLSFGGNCFVDNGPIPWPGNNVTSVDSFSDLFEGYNGGDNGNYVLSPGPCKGAGTDGSDPGANNSELLSVLTGGQVK